MPRPFQVIFGTHISSEVHALIDILVQETNEQQRWMDHHAKEFAQFAEQRRKHLEKMLRLCMQDDCTLLDERPNLDPRCEGVTHETVGTACVPILAGTQVLPGGSNWATSVQQGASEQPTIDGICCLMKGSNQLEKEHKVNGPSDKLENDNPAGSHIGQNQPCVERPESQVNTDHANTLLHDFAGAKGWTGHSGLKKKSGRSFPSFAQTPWNWQIALRTVTQHWVFSFAVGLLVLTNSVFIGLQVEYRHSRQSEAVFFAISVGFNAVFTLELLLRMAAQGLMFWWRDLAWNLFDVFMVVCSIVEVLLRLWQPPDAQGASNNMSIFRTLRVLRFIRGARVLRVTRLFMELRLMVFSILHSLKSLVWALLLLMVITFMFGSIFTQVVNEAAPNESPEDPTLKELEPAFGTVHRSMLTLLQAVLGGYSWAEMSDRLRYVHWAYELLFCGFMAFTSLALLNVVTGIFVESSMRNASNDRDVVIEDQIAQESSYTQELRRLFREADADGTGLLTLEEFLDYLKDQRVKSYLGALGIQTTEAAGLFNLLDLDSSGAVDVDEFMMGCLRLKGEAKGIDLATLMYENKRMVITLMAALEDLARGVREISGQRPGPSRSFRGLLHSKSKHVSRKPSRALLTADEG